MQSPVPGSQATNDAYPMDTLVPPDNNSSSLAGRPVLPVPPVPEYPASGREVSFHLYQDTEEILRNVGDRHQMSKDTFSKDMFGDHGLAAERLKSTDEHLHGAQCSLGLLHHDTSNNEDYGYHEFVSSDFGGVTTYGGTAMNQAHLFDPTVYNSLDDLARGPVVGCSATKPQMTKCAQSNSSSWAWDTTDGEKLSRLPVKERPVKRLERSITTGEIGSDTTGAVSQPTDKWKLQVDNQCHPFPDHIREEDSANSPFGIAFRPLAPEEILYYEMEQREPDDTIISQVPRTPSVFDSDDYSILNPGLCQDYYLDPNYQTRESQRSDENCDEDEGGTAVNSGRCEEMYATVDKQRDGLYATADSDDYSLLNPRQDCQVYYPNPEYQTRRDDSCEEDEEEMAVKKGAFEELYATVDKQRDGRTDGDGTIAWHQGITDNRNSVENSTSELYATVDKIGGKFPEKTCAVSASSCEEV
ncbi:uncharacterized protein [Diadema antillarum]|uniref:uncharacterized protein n=1 Tax=Diadema antillarum TaxID=105358 RepID=UPI003A850F66